MRVKILKAITRINVILLMLSMITMDSDSNIPFTLGVMALAWLLPFVLINKEALDKKYGTL